MLHRVESIEPSKKLGPHRDYQENLRYAENLSLKENTGKINGLRVKVCDSEHLKKALLIISWCPGNTVKKGNYATPIFLHQYNEDFKRTSESVLSFYKRTIKDHEGINPPQPEFLPANLKV
jgi:hypothetical protein